MSPVIHAYIKCNTSAGFQKQKMAAGEKKTLAVKHCTTNQLYTTHINQKSLLCHNAKIETDGDASF